MDSSLNLNGLANSLPSSNLANAEKELSGNFKDAALALATFYRSSRRTTKRAYNAGYMNACRDLLLMIQQGVSTGESSDAAAGRGMTIGRIMDYIEARLEAVKAQQEEEEEDEERERERERDKVSKGGAGQGVKIASVPATATANVPARVPLRTKDQGLTLPTPRTPSTHVAPSTSLFPSSTPPSPTSFSYPSPSPHSPSQISPTPFSLSRAAAAAAKSRTLSKDSSASPSIAFDPAMSTVPVSAHEAPSLAVVQPMPLPLSLFPGADSVVSLGTGSKRRHAAMLTSSDPGAMGDIAMGVQSSSSASRRRSTRGGRGAFGALSGQLREVQNHQSQSPASETMMDVEEDGRERKRVVRR